MIEQKSGASAAVRDCARKGAFDAKWRTLTLAANEAHSRQDYTQARSDYSLAYHEARMVFASAWNGNAELSAHAPPIMVVSAGNSARCYAAIGEQARAEEEVTSTINIFCQALTSMRAPQELKRECASALPRLLSVLIDLGVDEEDPRLEAAKCAALRFWRQATH